MKSVIFDFNGTLFVDSDKHRQGWKRFLAKYGKTLDDETFHAHFLGCTNDDCLRQAFGDDITPEWAHARALEKEATYRECCLADPAAFHLTEGAVAFLNFLKAADVNFTIATGSEVTNVDFYFKEFGLGQWFDRSRVVLDDGTFPGKPAPDGYLRAASVLGVAPADCVVEEVLARDGEAVGFGEPLLRIRRV